MVWAVCDLHNDLVAYEITDQPQPMSYVGFRLVNDTMARDYKKDDDAVRRSVLLERRRRRLWEVSTTALTYSNDSGRGTLALHCLPASLIRKAGTKGRPS
ncbi:hypothetical protein MRX96_029500 [Rhipicephalus microplus]